MAINIDTNLYELLDGQGSFTKTEALDIARIKYPMQPGVTVRQVGDLWYVVQRKAAMLAEEDSDSN